MLCRNNSGLCKQCYVKEAICNCKYLFVLFVFVVLYFLIRPKVDDIEGELRIFKYEQMMFVEKPDIIRMTRMYDCSCEVRKHQENILFIFLTNLIGWLKSFIYLFRF